jgi:NAD(P)-dependent dehydrogenase (short-subunit alcohol dehydrogenase family)
MDSEGLPLEGTLLAGKVAVVSGIGPGMGRDISIALAAQGADVVLGARREEHLVPVCEEIEAMGRRATWATCDIRKRDQCDELIATAVGSYGHLDILVNNAFRTEMDQNFETVDLEVWRKTMETNFFGTMHLTQAAVPALKESGNGRIVMINSTSSQIVEPGMGGYAASKGALATVTKTLARELGGYGIRVNGIHPGHIWGASVQWYFEHLAEQQGVTPDDIYGEIAAENCLGYLADSAEIAGTVVYLASDLSRPVTGQSINVGCGQFMQ